MYDYFQFQEYFINHIWFCHEGIHYKGKGILNWDPNDGFHISAHIKSSNLDFPLEKEFRSITFGTRINLYMSLGNGLRAIIPIFFPNEINLIHGRLSENSKRAIFIQPTSMPVGKTWFGKALFELRKKILFPDSVSVETRIGDSQPRQSYSRDGIHFEDETGMKVIGFQKENKYVEASWNLPKEHWTKAECWEYTHGLRYAISVLSGQALELKYREVYRPGRIFREVLISQEPISLGGILQPFDYDILDREKIVELAKFFTKGEQKAEVARKIFRQMAEAARQRSNQGQELLLSTILEAALRTIYNSPFDHDAGKRSKSFRIDRFLKLFREEYLLLSPEDNKLWRRATSKAAQSYRRLRHRNAHPDWLSTEGGSYSEDELERTTNDIIYLSRFYGYVIMGLAGFRLKKPLFPLPVSEWKPMMTMTIGKPRKPE